jgi:hypothetical protein
MAKTNRPKRGSNWEWIYPRSEDVLKECGMRTIEEYILAGRQTIAVYMVTRPILNECRQGERKRGAIPRRWWWEQPMDLDAHDRIGSDE